jgi:transcriptional regulator with XRE-family HTH domain
MPAKTKPNLAIIGRQLRAARQTHQLSLRELGQEADLSTAMLSLIELNKVNPSLPTLSKIAEALNVPLDYFFRSTEIFSETSSPVVNNRENEPAHLVRGTDRPRIDLASGVTLSTLTLTTEPGIQLFELKFAPNTLASRPKARHDGKEFGLVLEGRLMIELGEQAYDLNTGDSLMIECAIPHQLSNPYDQVVRVVWISLGDHFCLFEHFGS